MNFNLSSLLQNGMRILNIVNRTLPLVREINPAYSFITKKIKDMKGSTNNFMPSNTTLKAPNNYPLNQQSNGTNSLTFFR